MDELNLIAVSTKITSDLQGLYGSLSQNIDTPKEWLVK